MIFLKMIIFDHTLAMIVSSLQSTGLCPSLYQTWTGKENLDALCASLGPTLIDDINECLRQPCHVNATCTGNEVCKPIKMLKMVVNFIRYRILR